MGLFSTALAVEQGEPLKRRYLQIGNDAYQVVQQITQIGADYAALRADITTSGDAEDVATADGGFAQTVADAAVAFASLTTEQRQWVDQFFADLGYTRS